MPFRLILSNLLAGGICVCRGRDSSHNPEVNCILPEITESLYPFEACLLNLTDSLKGESIVRIKEPL